LPLIAPKIVRKDLAVRPCLPMILPTFNRSTFIRRMVLDSSGGQTTILLAYLLFLGCGLLSAYLPPRRAAMTEPIEIPREE
jgi:ABC-type lipoprotein release transport system permease subunit